MAETSRSRPSALFCSAHPGPPQRDTTRTASLLERPRTRCAIASTIRQRQRSRNRIPLQGPARPAGAVRSARTAGGPVASTAACRRQGRSAGYGRQIAGRRRREFPGEGGNRIRYSGACPGLLRESGRARRRRLRRRLTIQFPRLKSGRHGDREERFRLHPLADAIF